MVALVDQDFQSGIAVNHEPAQHRTKRWEMLDHGRELIAKAERDKLLRQIEEGLAHSREIIAHIREVLAQRR